MGKYRYVLLDMDETILDFKLAEHVTLQKTMEQFGLKYSPKIEVRYSETNLSLWKRLERGEISRAELQRMRFEMTFPGVDGLAMNTRWLDNLSSCGFYLPGARDFMERLAKTDLHVYIITNGMSKTQNGRIREAGLADYVDKAYISEEMGAVKPDPLYADMVVEDIGDPDRSSYLVVGDSLTSDIKLAENSGMDSCLFVAWGKSIPEGYGDHDITYIAHGYDELLEAILS